MAETCLRRSPNWLLKTSFSWTAGASTCLLRVIQELEINKWLNKRGGNVVFHCTACGQDNEAFKVLILLVFPDIRKALYRVAVSNNVRHKFPSQNQVAIKYFLIGFKERRQELVLRKPKISLYRCRGLKKGEISKYCKLLV